MKGPVGLLNPACWMDHVFLWVFSVTGVTLSLDAIIDVVINVMRYFI